jgi:hypothetical protein
LWGREKKKLKNPRGTRVCVTKRAHKEAYLGFVRARGVGVGAGVR